MGGFFNKAIKKINKTRINVDLSRGIVNVKRKVGKKK